MSDITDTPVDPRQRYVGMTWAEVLEANEHFDGEPEATAMARSTWLYNNAIDELTGTPGGTRFIPYLDRGTEWGDVDEMVMHAMEAWNDRNNP